MPGGFNPVSSGRNLEVGEVSLRGLYGFELAFQEGDFVGIGQGIETTRIGVIARAGVVGGRLFVGHRQAGAKAGGDRGVRADVFEHEVERDGCIRVEGAAGDAQAESYAVLLVCVDEGVIG